MDKELKILILEDSPQDAELEVLELKKQNLAFSWKRAETKDEFVKALDEFCPDIILSDYHLPSFDAPAALEIALRKCPDTPFIVVTGAVGDIAAVELIKKGAKDYILKDHLPKLCSAVERAMLDKLDLLLLKQADKALQVSDLEWQATFDAIQDLVMLLDKDWKIKKVNHAMEKYLNLPAAEITGKTCYKFMHNADSCIPGCPLEMARQSMKREEIELNLAEKGIWIHVSFDPLFDSQGSFSGGVHIIKDITESKKAQDSIRAERDFTRKSIDALNHPFYVLGLDHKIGLCNKTAKDKGLFEGGLCYRLTHGLQEPCSGEEVCPLEEVIRTDKSVTVEHRHRDGSGKESIIEVHGDPILNKDGRTAEMIEYSIDITERKKAEEALREKEERFRAIFNTTFQFTGLMTLDGTLIEANQSAVDFTGLKLEDVINRPFWETHWWRGNEERVKKLKESIRLAASGKFIRYEVELQGSGDATAIFDFSIKPSFGYDGSVAMLVPEGRDITERKKAEEDLRESEEKYRMLFTSAAEGILMADVKTRQFQYANPAICRMFGYAQEEMLRLGLADIHPKESLGRVQADFEAQLRGEKLSTELPCLRKDGTIFYASISAAGSVLGGLKFNVGFFTDITERKKAEEELKKSERLYHLLADNAADFIWTADMDLNFIYVSPSVARIFGYRPEELGRKNVSQIIAPGSMPETMMTLSEELAIEAKGNVDIYRTRLIRLEQVRKDGTIVWAETNMAFLRDENNKPIGIVGATRDITERMKAEEELAESEAKYRALYESAKDAIMILGPPNWFFISGNPAAVEMFAARNEAQFISKRPYDLSPEHQSDGKPSMVKALEMINTAMKEGSALFEWTHKRINGEEFPAMVLLTKVKVADKEFLQATVRDISELKKIEESQRLAQLGQLVSSMVHEINNPLMIISGNAQLCLTEELNKQAKENLGIIIEQCARTKSIIQRLLAFSKPTKGEIKNADINAVVDSTAKLLEHQYSVSNIKMIRNFAAQLPMIPIDEKQIQEVLLNIIKNAAEAMPEGGVITMATSQEGPFLRIDIADTGMGIPKEAMEKLFTPFFTTKDKGTGLGLPVCYGLVRAHGGDLEFNSVVGKGTTAAIYLPLEPKL